MYACWQKTKQICHFYNTTRNLITNMFPIDSTNIAHDFFFVAPKFVSINEIKCFSICPKVLSIWRTSFSHKKANKLGFFTFSGLLLSVRQTNFPQTPAICLTKVETEKKKEKNAKPTWNQRMLTARVTISPRSTNHRNLPRCVSRKA